MQRRSVFRSEVHHRSPSNFHNSRMHGSRSDCHQVHTRMDCQRDILWPDFPLQDPLMNHGSLNDTNFRRILQHSGPDPILPQPLEGAAESSIPPVDPLNMQYQSFSLMADGEQHLESGSQQYPSFGEQTTNQVMSAPCAPGDQALPSKSRRSNLTESVRRRENGEPEVAFNTVDRTDHGNHRESRNLISPYKDFENVNDNEQAQGEIYGLAPSVNYDSGGLFNEDGQFETNEYLSDRSSLLPVWDVQALRNENEGAARFLSTELEDHERRMDATCSRRATPEMVALLRHIPLSVISSYVRAQNFDQLDPKDPSVSHASVLDHHESLVNDSCSQLLLPSFSDIFGIPVAELVGTDQASMSAVQDEASQSAVNKSWDLLSDHDVIELDLSHHLTAGSPSGSSSFGTTGDGKAAKIGNRFLLPGCAEPYDFTFLKNTTDHLGNDHPEGSSSPSHQESILDVCKKLKKFSSKISKQREVRPERLVNLKYYSFKRIMRDLREIASLSEVLSRVAAQLKKEDLMLNAAYEKESQEIANLREMLESQKS